MRIFVRTAENTKYLVWNVPARRQNTAVPSAGVKT